MLTTEYSAASAAGEDMTLMRCPANHVLYTDEEGNDCTSIYWGVSVSIELSFAVCIRTDQDVGTE